MYGKFILICFVVFGLVFSTIPGWVQPGLSLTYEGYSAYVSEGQYSDSITTDVSINVNSVSQNSVSGVAYVGGVALQGYIDEYPFTCYEEQPCDWLFWVDPNNPVGSAVGPNGEEYIYVGDVGEFSYEGVYIEGSYSVDDAAMLLYQNEGVE